MTVVDEPIEQQAKDWAERKPMSELLLLALCFHDMAVTPERVRMILRAIELRYRMDLTRAVHNEREAILQLLQGLPELPGAAWSQCTIASLQLSLMQTMRAVGRAIKDDIVRRIRERAS
jgi:hypothetical protein